MSKQKCSFPIGGFWVEVMKSALFEEPREWLKWKSCNKKMTENRGIYGVFLKLKYSQATMLFAAAFHRMYDW